MHTKICIQLFYLFSNFLYFYHIKYLGYFLRRKDILALHNSKRGFEARLGFRGLVRMVRRWGCYVYEEPHKDSNMRMCVSERPLLETIE